MPATRKRTRAQLKEAKLEEAPPQTCVASPTKSARIGRSKTVPTRRAATKAAPAVDAPATPKPALKRAASERKSSVKKSPSLKRSSSVASLPEGWTCVAPDTALGVEDMLESVSNDAAPAGTACKIVNWNVNGLKAFMKNTKDLLVPYLEREAPDVLCLNEIKLTEDNCDSYNDKFPGYKCHFNCCTVKKGYAGTAILVREASQLGELGVTYGMGVKELDNEGRVTTLELPWGYVVVAYVPNSGMKLDRLDYRTKTWDPAFRAYLASLQATKSVVVVGDLNVAHEEPDLAKPRTNRNKTPGFCDGERDNFGLLLHDDGFIDTWRESNPTVQCFSYWSYRFSCRDKNIGWRLDYCLASPDLQDSVKEAFIRRHVRGSDHAPVGVVLATKPASGQ